MESYIAIEWAPQISGINYEVVVRFADKIMEALSQGQYGNSITKIRIILICRTRKLSQRKRFSKVSGIFDFDIILDIDRIKDATYDEKKKIIRNDIIAITEKTFDSYKFVNFQKEEFLLDFKQIVNSLEW